MSSEWVTTIVTQHVRTGELKAGSMRIFRSPTPPPCTKDEGTPVPRYAGPLTRIIGLQGAASDFWDVAPKEMRVYPKELADQLVRQHIARYATAAEIAASEI